MLTDIYFMGTLEVVSDAGDAHSPNFGLALVFQFFPRTILGFSVFVCPFSFKFVSVQLLTVT